jgi:MerR family redox-sensitive transcriptional activator SoxR
MEEDLTIGRVAEAAGLRPSALRYYESVGLLRPPRRVGGRRRYDPGVLEDLAFIRTAQGAGFTIREIRALVEGVEEGLAPSARWRELARAKLPEIDALIERAREMKSVLEAGLRCGCQSLGECSLPGRG